MDPPDLSLEISPRWCWNLPGDHTAFLYSRSLPCINSGSNKRCCNTLALRLHSVGSVAENRSFCRLLPPHSPLHVCAHTRTHLCSHCRPSLPLSTSTPEQPLRLLGQPKLVGLWPLPASCSFQYGGAGSTLAVCFSVPLCPCLSGAVMSPVAAGSAE